MRFRRPPDLYTDPPLPEPLRLPSLSELEDLRREANNLELERDAVISAALQIAEEKDRLAEMFAITEGDLRGAQAVIEAVRNVLKGTRYFDGADVDVIEGVGLLAKRAEAERSRP